MSAAGKRSQVLGGARVAMLHPWDLLSVVPFPAEIWYHSKLSGPLQKPLETAVSTNLEDKI